MEVCALGSVTFPAPQNIWINMMPFILGDGASIPEEYRHYWPLIQACQIEKDEQGHRGYLSIMESFVNMGMTQRRGGIHTDGHGSSAWGWGRGDSVAGKRMRGLYMASTTSGHCRAWDVPVIAPGPAGDCEALRETLETTPAVIMQANTLYWLTDRCPHESLPAQEETYRQWVRVVTQSVDVWYAYHSTANRLGVQPAGLLIPGDKFAQAELRKVAC